MEKILDACCGSRMFWFDKENEYTMYMDIRELDTNLSDGRKLEIKPDIVADFRDMPFEDETFHLVVFDPPHLVRGATQVGLYKSMEGWIKTFGRLI